MVFQCRKDGTVQHLLNDKEFKPAIVCERQVERVSHVTHAGWAGLDAFYIELIVPDKLYGPRTRMVGINLLLKLAGALEAHYPHVSYDLSYTAGITAQGGTILFPTYEDAVEFEKRLIPVIHIVGYNDLQVE